MAKIITDLSELKPLPVATHVHAVEAMLISLKAVAERLEDKGVKVLVDDMSSGEQFSRMVGTEEQPKIKPGQSLEDFLIALQVFSEERDARSVADHAELGLPRGTKSQMADVIDKARQLVYGRVVASLAQLESEERRRLERNMPPETKHIVETMARAVKVVPEAGLGIQESLEDLNFARQELAQATTEARRSGKTKAADKLDVLSDALYAIATGDMPSMLTAKGEAKPAPNIPITEPGGSNEMPGRRKKP